MKPLSTALQVQTLEDIQEQVRQKLDEFLDVYSFYRQTGITWIHDEMKLKAYELHLLNPAFNYLSN